VSLGAGEPAATPRRREASFVRDFLRHKPKGVLGAVIVGVLVLTAVFADRIAAHKPEQIRAVQRFRPPSQAHWFGTDDFGRDVFSRVAHGARISLRIGITAVLLGTTVGALIGLVSGYFGGRTDLMVQRVMDGLMAFPALVLALAVVAALGASVRNVIIAVGLTLAPAANRLVRSVALSVRETPFVMAARALGGSHGRVVFRHVLPNCLAPYLVVATANLGSAIVAEASLGFLGLGVPPPAPAWGSMLSGATQTYLFRAPWMAVFPGLAISLAVFGFNMFGDAVRDLLDPRLKGRA
jgi:peptide/nickel transport system permease protein